MNVDHLLAFPWRCSFKCSCTLPHLFLWRWTAASCGVRLHLHSLRHVPVPEVYIWAFCRTLTTVCQRFISIWRNTVAEIHIYLWKIINNRSFHKNLWKKIDLHIESSIILTPPTGCVAILELGQTHTCAFTSSAAFTTPPATSGVLYAHCAIKCVSFVKPFLFLYYFFRHACCPEDVP